MNGMSDIVKSITRIILAPLFLFGAYIMLSAPHSHGAGFAGGVIIALAVLLLLMVFGRHPAMGSLRATHLETIVAAALLGFLGTTAITIFVKDPLVPGIPGAHAYLLLLSNTLLCLAVAASLLIVFLSLLAFRGPEEQ